MSVITQNGDSPLMKAVMEGRTEVVSLLIKDGANIDLQKMVKCQQICTRWFDLRRSVVVLLCYYMFPFLVCIVCN